MKTLFFAVVIITFSSLLFSATEGEKTMAFFQANQNQPYHLSIGAVLFNQKGQVACHHFEEFLGHRDIYILMRESMENDETPLKTLHRGLMEEFGAVGKPLAFLGSLSGHLPSPNLPFDKTTLYIACELVDWNPKNRDSQDPEASSTIEWHESEDLISIMKQQGIRFNNRVDADESEMIKRALPYIEQSLSNKSLKAFSVRTSSLSSTG